MAPTTRGRSSASDASAAGSAETADRPAGTRRRAPRSDALANRENLLVAAADVVRRRGHAVPLAEVASAAGVGVGTLYRHFPDRDALLAALARRSYDLVLDAAREAAEAADTPAEALGRFFDRIIARRAELVLPLVGGPGSFENSDPDRRADIVAALDRIVDRGVAERSLRPDATATDIVLTGALLAQPATPTLDWDRIARRHASIYLDGLRVGSGHRAPDTPVTRGELEQALATPDAARPADP